MLLVHSQDVLFYILANEQPVIPSLQCMACRQTALTLLIRIMSWIGLVLQLGLTNLNLKSPGLDHVLMS